MTSTADSTAGVSFDVNGFMSGVIQSVNSSRSDLFTEPSKIVENLANEQASEGVESRINTFYRLLGLPATRNEALLGEKKPTKSQLSQYNTLNYAEVIEIVDLGNSNLNAVKLDKVELSKRLIAREEFYRKPPPPSQMLKMVQTPLRISDSILGVSERKNSIFPTVVDAATPVYPLQKRTAPAFYDGDFLLSGAKNIKLPRPFIENVIYIRTYVFAGGDTSNFQASVVNNLKTFVGNSSNLTTEQLDTLLTNVGVATTSGFFSRLEGELIFKLVEALKSCAVEYKQVVSQANEFKSKVRFSPVSSDTPGIMLANTTEILEKAVAGELDKTISRISLELETVVKRLAMLPTNKIMEAETNFRADAGLANLSITADAFMSDFSSLITFERPSIEKRLDEAKGERQKAISEYNKILEKIQYFTGEGTGLSVFEVLCVFLALFTIDVKDLVSLLNKDARERLLASPYYSFQNSVANADILKKPIFESGENISKVETALSVSSGTVSFAIETFEQRIKENFALAEAFFVSAEKVSQDSPGVGGNNYVYNTY